MITNIIPITFIGGSGGHFLAHWLITARNGDDDGILLSGAGNAHSGKFDIPLCPYNLNDPDELKIEYAISSSAVAPRRSPFFVPLHILHPESCHRHFSKFIRVTYTLDDMQELSVVFLLKNLIEGRNIQPMMYNTKLREREYFLRRNMSFFSEIRNENVLCVSWN